MAMLRIMVALALAVAAAAQTGTQPAPNAAGAAASSAGGTVNPVRFDHRGWPILSGDPARTAEVAAPSATVLDGEAAASPGATDPQPLPAQRSSGAPVESASGRNAGSARPASGMQLDSPLIDVFRATRSPAALRELGGVELTWRLTIHGVHGEAIGVREVKHLADCAYAERDRLDFEDGRASARVGAFVSVEQQGIPSPSMVDAASDELMLFGMHLRMPWCFGDGEAFAVLRRDVSQRNGERMMHIVLERRPPASLDLLGPELDPSPRDRYELFCDPSTGRPRELVHRFAKSLETRRVLLEDWREIEGVVIPFRRVYVDESLRPTTTLELQRRPERTRVSERDFRLAM